MMNFADTIRVSEPTIRQEQRTVENTGEEVVELLAEAPPLLFADTTVTWVKCEHELDLAVELDIQEVAKHVTNQKNLGRLKQHVMAQVRTMVRTKLNGCPRCSGQLQMMS